ncbi:MAG: hypothetical protein K0S65_2075 [Labilithrix sp.]|jgi:hypothetical protein|nr:hypothetical protein [Labilithrix sp.]
MSTVVTVNSRPVTHTALQVIVGQTSASTIRAFAGTNVNVGANIVDEYDIRWVTLYTEGGAVEMRDGDWIVKDEHGRVRRVPQHEFDRLYEVAS